ncbi:MAG TPA: hypothetical protein VM580_16660, partial [Labilithrix sp.]|nr:hypothetical protein [Labilithrix sp.]
MTALNLVANVLHDGSAVPLTAYQRDIWISESFAPEFPIYTIGGYKKLTGAVDVGLLRRCAERVLNGTDICHLRFREENGVVFM